MTRTLGPTFLTILFGFGQFLVLSETSPTIKNRRGDTTVIPLIGLVYFPEHKKGLLGNPASIRAAQQRGGAGFCPLLRHPSVNHTARKPLLQPITVACSHRFLRF